MLEELRFYSKYLALVVAVIALFKYKDYAHTNAKYFLYSVWYIVLTEFIGSKFYYWFGVVNYSVFNLYTFLQLLFYIWWFRSLITSIRKKHTLLVLMFLYTIFSSVNLLFIQDYIYETATYQYALGVIFVVIAICFFFIEMFATEKVLNLTSSKYFWFSIGILIFHATFMPFYFAFKYFFYGNSKPLSVANFVLCFIMYTCFAIGFLKAKRNIDN